MKIMARIKFLTHCVAATCCLGGVGTAFGQQFPPAISWNAYAVVPGRLLGDGTAYACDNPEAKPSGHGCWVPGLIATNAGHPRKISVDELLQLKVKGALPQGKTARLVGVGPWWTNRSNGKSSSLELDHDSFMILYNIE